MDMDKIVKGTQSRMRSEREALVYRLTHYPVGSGIEMPDPDTIWRYAIQLGRCIALPIGAQARRDGWYVLVPYGDARKVYSFEECPLEFPPKSLHICFSPFGSFGLYREAPAEAIVLQFARG